MKKIIIIGFYSAFFIPLLFSQNKVHHGGDFTKSIEYNSLSDGYEKFLKNKGLADINLFSGSNAQIEFIYRPPFHGNSGFRVLRNSLDSSYYIEIKRIMNPDALRDLHTYMYQSSLGFPAYQIPSIPEDVRVQIIEHNKTMYSNYEELAKRINVETHSYPISRLFAEELYKKMLLFIDNFEAKRVFQTDIYGGKIVFAIADGESVSFRTVIDNEVRSLSIHVPLGNALKMTDLCLKIITDAIANKLDESKYITALSSFEN